MLNDIQTISDGPVKLIPIGDGDTENIVRWRNKDIVRNNLFNTSPITHDDHRKWLENYVYTGKCHQFIIHAEDTPIGSIFLKNIDQKNYKAEFGIFIGEESLIGKGYGTTAANIITNYGFNSLQLNKIYLLVFAENHRAVRSYEKVGFVQEGLFRRDQMVNGEFKDVITMAIFKE